MSKTQYKFNMDSPIWDITQPLRYVKMFLHLYSSPSVFRDNLHWLDFLKGNKN